MYYLYCEDLAAGLVGPFKTKKKAHKHRKFLEERGDADPGKIITAEEATPYLDQIKADTFPGVFMSPKEDRKDLWPQFPTHCLTKGRA